MDTGVGLRTLASYAGELAGGSEVWGLRVLLHEFGMVWEGAAADERAGLIAEEPAATGDPRWDAFLAAYAEYLAYHAGIAAPEWTAQPRRFLEVFWFPGTARWPALRVEALVHAPAQFEAHGVLLARRELHVV